MKKVYLFTLLCICSVFFPVHMVSPADTDVNWGDEIFLGKMGPGQTIYIEMNPWVYSEDEYKGHYDLMLAYDLPEGWKSTESKLYEDPMQITITSFNLEKEGTYPIKIKIIDEDGAENIGDIEFTGKIEILHDIMDVNIEPEKISTGAGQPARFYITVVNKGLASDVFEIRTENTLRWNFKKVVYVPEMSSKTIVYEIVENEQEKFNPIIIVESKSSKLIIEKHDLELDVNTNLFNDFKAVNHGTVIFPILQEPIFALMGILSNLW
ncbi:MAG: hypothetical protein WC501_02980 [Candidatus Micrarchaeia archaeon]